MILAACALVTLPALQRSADHLAHLYRRHDAEAVLNRLVAQADLKLKTDRHLRDFASEGEVVENGVPFRYQIAVRPVNEGGLLMELQVTVNWLGEGTSGLSRSAYVAV